MTTPAIWDAVVVGGGPAGLFAAWRLAQGGARVALVEAGGGMRASLCPRVSARMRGQQVRPAEKFRLQCNRCDCLTGLGGAAFHFDTNLGYVRGLSRSKIEQDSSGAVRAYSGLERTLGDFDRAAAEVARVYELMAEFGLPPAGTHIEAAGGTAGTGFAAADEAVSQAITVDDALTMVDALLLKAEANGLHLRTGCRVEDVDRQDGVWSLRLSDGTQFRSRSVVMAVGKLGLDWIRPLLQRHGIAHDPARRVDVGVRLEMPQEVAAPLTASCHNPKFTFLNDGGEPVRTFCVCDGGRIMQYSFLDTVILDGQHCLTTPTKRTNFGIVTTVDVPAGADGTEHALGFARRVNQAGGGLPVVQPLVEMLGRERLTERPSSSLIYAADVDLAAAMGPERVADIAGMVHRLEALAPGLIGPRTVVAAPVVEKLYPAIELSPDMESSAAGLYFTGDCSSKIIGVTYGAATGLVAAESILRD
ncbi:FAD-dependent oxidoreductase [Actinoplanes sp. LDG1-06]|uniref:FAD-dependent oxidoreductase n=1 Tax=Paractinoplanes ovalisporus TaxID=2810368 RepID=A0ABS2AME3_9ACTN|nr:FAD-dependent oxidoreductase [Actinoplanes ovalisporus]MBM2620374.1 FAD-dependent oxidoreductase [Actinoplanes ovalisporus]